MSTIVTGKINKVALAIASAGVFAASLAVAQVEPDGASRSKAAKAKTSASAKASKTSSGASSGAPITVLLPNIKQSISRVGSFAEAVAPGTITADMITKQLGEKLGDPDLSGLGDGGALLRVSLGGPPVAYLEVSKEKSAAYKKAIGATSGASISQQEDMLVLAQDDSTLEGAVGSAADARKEFAAKPSDVDVRATVNVAALVKQFEPQMEAGIKMLSSTISKAAAAKSSGTGDSAGEGSGGGAGRAKMFEAIMRGYLAAIKKIDSLTVDASVPDEGFLLTYSIHPTGGVSVAKTKADGAKLLALLPAELPIRMKLSADPKELMSFYEDIVGDVAGQMGAEDAAEVQSFKKWMSEWGGVMDGSVAAVGGAGKTEKVQAAYAFGLTDPAAALTLMKNMNQRSRESGFLKLYAEMGMPMEMDFKADVRKHAGVSIHRMETKFDTSKMAPEMAKQITAMGDLSANVAIVENTMFGAIGDQKIEDLIDAAKSGNGGGKQTQAEKMLPAGGSFYLDYDIVKVFTGMAVGDNPQAEKMKAMFSEAAKSGAPPIAMAGYGRDDAYEGRMLVPKQFIVSMVKAGMSQGGAAGGGKSSDASSSSDTTAPPPSGASSTDEGAPTPKAKGKAKPTVAPPSTE